MSTRNVRRVHRAGSKRIRSMTHVGPERRISIVVRVSVRSRCPSTVTNSISPEEARPFQWRRTQTIRGSTISTPIWLACLNSSRMRDLGVAAEAGPHPLQRVEIARFERGLVASQQLRDTALPDSVPAAGASGERTWAAAAPVLSRRGAAGGARAPEPAGSAPARAVQAAAAASRSWSWEVAGPLPRPVFQLLRAPQARKTRRARELREPCSRSVRRPRRCGTARWLRRT